MAEGVQPGVALLWVSQDKAAATEVVFRYTRNSRLNNWWDRVRLIVWGPSAKLLAEDEELQDLLDELKEVGVELYACRGCADRYGVSEKFAELGINVIYMGEPLTRLLKEGWHVLTI